MAVNTEKDEIDYSFKKLLSISFQANFLLNASPIGVFLGDGYKIMQLRNSQEKSITDLIFSIFFDRYLGVTSAAILSIFCIPFIFFNMVLYHTEFVLIMDLLLFFYLVSLFTIMFLPFILKSIGSIFFK